MEEAGKRKRSRKRGKRPDSGESKAAQQASNAFPSQSDGAASKEFLQRVNPYKPSGFASSSSNPAPTANAAPSTSTASARLGPKRRKNSSAAGRHWTLSVALPGSIILNAQTPELQARLAGGLARTCAIFNVDEVIVFHEDVKAGTGGDDWPRGGRKGVSGYQREDRGAAFKDDAATFDPDAFLARILQYLETPQYLRKALFPMHKDLRLAGLLPPLDCPHHLRYEDVSTFREGVIVESPSHARAHKKRRYDDNASELESGQVVDVDVGLGQPVQARIAGAGSTSTAPIPAGSRVTIRMPSRTDDAGMLVSPRQPVKEAGAYWGYSVRLCSSLSEVLTTCPFGNEVRQPSHATDAATQPEAEYDLILGTSERGTSLTELLEEAMLDGAEETGSNAKLKPFKHALLVLGGLSGLEVIIDQDPTIDLGAHQASLLFDAWINVLENQGSRTIRTEEALPIALARLKTFFEVHGT